MSKRKHEVRPRETKKSARLEAGVTAPPQSSEYDCPVFSLKHMQDGKYCVRSRECSRDDRAAFAVALHKLSQLTWADIRRAHRHGLGSEFIEQQALKVGIPACIEPGAKLIAVRFNGLKPMVGFREGTTFHILWLDHDFSLYDHG